MADPNTRQGKRTPVTLKIKFKSETLDQFIERYAVDVSSGGIFIRTKEPLGVGTQMKFEFQLRDASPLIAGEGTVVWTRENDPSRPAIAPGMGVRFDRLADGSQGILERILTEKAKQAPQRPATDTAKPPLFTDTPTRVAPAPVQDALLGKDGGQRRRDDSASHNDSHTPLPKPMPFHSDADEFPDEAFEEATKVRALDELIAQTADSAPAHDEITGRGRNGRSDDAGPDRGDRGERGEPRPIVMPAAGMAAELQDASDLPNPPDIARPQARLLDTSPSPRIEASPPPLGDNLGKTKLGVEPARSWGGSPSQPPFNITGPSITGGFPAPGELPSLPSSMRAVAAEPTEPARLPPLKSRSSAPLFIVIFLVVAAAGAAVWFLVLRPGQLADSRGSAAPTAPEAPGAAATAPPAPSATQPPGTPPTAGSNAVAAGSGSAATSGAAASQPHGEVIDTVIGANADGATVEIPGTDQSGPAPFTARLEKGKSYKARITAHGFATLELDVIGGSRPSSAKLVAKPRIISVNSDPPGAAIAVDGAPTGHVTPFELELPTVAATKKSVRIALRKQGFRTLDRAIDFAKLTEDDVKMTGKLDEKLAVAPVVPVAKPKPAAGSDSGSAGSDTAAPSSGDTPVTSPQPSGDTATPPPAPPSPAAPAPSTGSSAEPEPDFNKPH